jgi:hypothetical protein
MLKIFGCRGVSSILDKEMVTLFANMLKTPYYEHVMGSSAQ